MIFRIRVLETWLTWPALVGSIRLIPNYSNGKIAGAKPTTFPIYCSGLKSRLGERQRNIIVANFLDTESKFPKIPQPGASESVMDGNQKDNIVSHLHRMPQKPAYVRPRGIGNYPIDLFIEGVEV